MKQHQHLRQAFVGFHLTLGLTLLVQSLSAVARPGRSDPHVLVLGALEALAAVLFLMPRLMRVGAALLLVSLAAAMAIHATRGQFPGALLVYAAGVIFVAVHGTAYDVRSRVASAA